MPLKIISFAKHKKKSKKDPDSGFFGVTRISGFFKTGSAGPDPDRKKLDRIRNTDFEKGLQSCGRIIQGCGTKKSIGQKLSLLMRKFNILHAVILLQCRVLIYWVCFCRYPWNISTDFAYQGPRGVPFNVVPWRETNYPLNVLITARNHVACLVYLLDYYLFMSSIKLYKQP